MKANNFFGDKQLHDLFLCQAVKEAVEEQPVIILSHDTASATEVFNLLKKEVDCDFELFAELADIGDIDKHDFNYRKTKTKLDNLKKKSRVVVVAPRDAARGVDF